MSIESTAHSPERRYTADDLLGMENAVCYELHDGQLVWRGTGEPVREAPIGYAWDEGELVSTSTTMDAPSSDRRYTADDLLDMEDGVRYELHDGKLVLREMSDRSSWVGMNVGRILGNFVYEHRLGFLRGSDAGLAILPKPGEFVRADVVFTSRERMGGKLPADGHATVAPELVVEVHSRHDRVRDVDTKVEAYFAAGVLLIWLVNPDTRVVRVLRADGFEKAQTADDVVLIIDFRLHHRLGHQA